ncbi:MAG: VanZ family protein [Candidatus Cloacimonetes bacterium]|nr:VanZ family protein [Candidatus Cloacimonadota bacterium]
MNYKTLSLVPSILVMTLIFNLSSGPVGVELPTIDHLDKILHFFAYGFLAICYWIALITYKVKKNYPIAVGLTFLFGCSDEFHQSFIPSRTPELLDIVADTCGAVVCVFVVNCLYLSYLKRNSTSA